MSITKRSLRPLGSRILCVVLPVLILSACSEKPEKPEVVRPVFAMQLVDAGSILQRSFPGRARAASELNRSFRVSGPLITFPVKVGDKVSQGDILARIDPTDFENVQKSLQGQLAREQANQTRAQADFRRVDNVFKTDPGATSEAALDRTRQMRDSAIATVSSVQARVKEASDQLSYTYLKAPFNGVVVETYAENFETVVAGQPILRLLDASQIEFVINVPENLISYAPYVEDVQLTFDAFSDTKIPASISEIGKEASQATRTYPVTLLMQQPEGVNILPGMAGEALIVGSLPKNSSRSGTEVPATAVFTAGEMKDSYVWVIDEASNTLSQRKVQIRGMSQFGILIDGEVNVGDWIVTKGVNSLQEGQKVRRLGQEKDRGA